LKEKDGLILLKRMLCPFLLVSTLCACAPQSAQRTIFAMDTIMDLQVNGPGARSGIQAVTDKINELDRLWSVTRQESEVWAVNHAQGEPVPVSGDTLALLERAVSLGDATQGALDVTLYPVLKAWGFTTQSYQIPSEEELARLVDQVDYRAAAVDRDAGSVALPAGMELDFGALAKGYAGEVCAELLRAQGVKSALLSLGGNVQTVGTRSDGSPWRVLVQDPAGETGAYLGVVELEDQAAVTSGGYQRYFERGGVRYWHILDPDTGAPARSGLTSVTVVGEQGSVCDGLSTALFVLGREEALAFWREYGESLSFQLILVDEDGGITVTQGLEDAFSLAEDAGYTLEIAQ